MNKIITKQDLLTRLTIKSSHELQAIEQQSLTANILPASVLIPIIDTTELAVLFTERTAHLTHHAGQISFPGGRKEAIDYSLQDTCLRETTEEIGINPNHITIIGNLAPLNSVSGFSVTPFIGLIDPHYQIKIDPYEVENIFTVPLNFLLDPANQQRQPYIYQGKLRNIHVIQYEQYRIWGLTAKIIIDLTRALGIKI